MSRKQEIYRDILSWALPSARNTFSWYRQIKPIVVLWPKSQRYLAAQYRLAEFVHNIYVSLLKEEFTDHDIWFLNHQARNYYESGGEFDAHFDMFCHYIQQLFAEVPAEQRDKLNWQGPQEDYSWARPRRGFEFTPEVEQEIEEGRKLAVEARKRKKSSG